MYLFREEGGGPSPSVLIQINPKPQRACFWRFRDQLFLFSFPLCVFCFDFETKYFQIQTAQSPQYILEVVRERKYRACNFKLGEIQFQVTLISHAISIGNGKGLFFLVTKTPVPPHLE